MSECDVSGSPWLWLDIRRVERWGSRVWLWALMARQLMLERKCTRVVEVADGKECVFVHGVK